MNTKFKRVLFDYDGTILLPDRLNEGKNIAKILGIPTEFQDEFIKEMNNLFSTGWGLNKYVGKKITKDLCYIAIQEMMLPYERFNVTPKQIYEATIKNSEMLSTVLPSTFELLDYLKEEGYRLDIFSNSFYVEQMSSMKYNKVFDYFEKIYTWDDFYAKPDRRAIERVIEGDNPEEIVMVGDNVKNDIIVQKKHGIYTIGYNPYFDDIMTQNADITVNSLLEIKTKAIL